MRLPAYLNPNRLQGRIVSLFLALLLLVQLGSMALVSRAVESEAERRLQRNLGTAQDLLRNELHRRLTEELTKSQLLAADYGFRQTLGMRLFSDGPEAVRFALDQHAQRVGAEFAAFEANDGQLYASNPVAAQAVAAAKAMRSGAAEPGELRLALVQGRPLQLTRLTVMAPGPLGELVLGFELDSALLEQIKTLFNVDVVLGVRDAGQRWSHALHIEAPPDLPELLAQLAGQTPTPQQLLRLRWRDQQQLGRLVELPAWGSSATQRVSALLLSSLTEEVRPSSELRHSLLLLNLLGLALFALGSVFTARRLAEPIQLLRAAALRLGRGDYETPVRSPGRLVEVQQLAGSFETMRVGIREREAEVHRLAYWDGLTGLPNRQQFLHKLQQRLKASREPLALLMLNLDRFKPVNDALGRELGDELLKKVATRLQPFLGEAQRDGNLLARLGGDEFALWLDGCDEARARVTAQRLLKDFEHPLQLAEQTVDLSAGIGIALYPGHAVDADDLVSLAERAMELAKRRQAGVLLFEPSMDARSPASLGLLSELRRAVDHDELRLYLQPKLDLRSRLVVSAEALVRWQHPQQGMVPPGRFIPFAEQTGFVRQLSRWVLQASARLVAQARAAGQPLRISVNLSTRDLLDAELPQRLQALLAREDCPADGLCLEITESAIMDDPTRALQTVRALHAAGFKLSIDDFGTGYSSLAYLKQLPVQELKIDQSFVFGMVDDEDDRKIVHSTIELAHNLGLSVVAEGVETEAALELLAQLGCDEGQGYFIARPMPAQDLLAWLRARQ